MLIVALVRRSQSSWFPRRQTTSAATIVLEREDCVDTLLRMLGPLIDVVAQEHDNVALASRSAVGQSDRREPRGCRERRHGGDGRHVFRAVSAVFPRFTHRYHQAVGIDILRYPCPEGLLRLLETPHAFRDHRLVELLEIWNGEARSARSGGVDRRIGHIGVRRPACVEREGGSIRCKLAPSRRLEPQGQPDEIPVERRLTGSMSLTNTMA